MHKITLICVLFGFLDVIKCDWWENMLIYEIYTKSFKDSNGDGIGDINGITSKLDYIAELRVDAIWLPGIYASSSDDFDKLEYEITDHKQLNPIFGNLDDFQKLIAESHEKGLKVLLDFSPGYTSEKHIWFLKSVQNETIYTDYYIWANPQGFDKDGVAIPPGFQRHYPVWIFNRMKGQFYYTKSGEKLPKLNLRNPIVLEEMKKVLCFWLDIGVDGFFVKDPTELIIYGLFGTKHKEDTSTSSKQVLHEFRTLLDEYKNKDGSTRLLIANSLHSPRWFNTFYDNPNYTVTHFPFNPNYLMNHHTGFFNAKNVKRNIDEVLKYTAKGQVPAWASESHIRPRIPIILGLEHICIAAVQTLLLPGVASIFYGQEIGLRGFEKFLTDNDFFLMWFKQEFMLGLYDHKPASCPMQWDATEYAGFTNSAKGPWSGIRADYWKFNVDVQKKRKDSYYNFYKELIKLRKTDTCRYGDVETYDLSDYIFVFTRSRPGKEIYITVLNLSNKDGSAELNTLIPKSGKTLTVLISSPNAYQKKGEVLSVDSNGKLLLEMRPLSVAVVTTASSTK